MPTFRVVSPVSVTTSLGVKSLGELFDGTLSSSLDKALYDSGKIVFFDNDPEDSEGFLVRTGLKNLTPASKLAAQQALGVDLAQSLSPLGLVENEVPVVILLGQSNVDGRGKLSQALWLQGRTWNGQAKIYNKSITRGPATAAVNRVDNGAWTNLTYGTCMVVTPQEANGFGPELPLASIWADRYPNTPLYIIKCAVGGTTLGADSGSPDTDWTSSSTQLWELALNYVVRPAIHKLLAQGKKPRCLGVFWGQGESDATSALAPAYYANLKSHVERMGSKLGFADPKIIVMGLSDYNYPANEWGVVKAAQQSVVSEAANAILLSTDGYSRFPSSLEAGALHYNEAGITQLGRAIFGALDFHGASYAGISDSELYYNGLGVPISTQKFPFGGQVGPLRSGKFAVTSGSVNGLSFIYSAGYTDRLTVGDISAPYHKLSALDGAGDVEISGLIQATSASEKLGIIFRGNYGVSDWLNSYMVMARDGGATLRLYYTVGERAWTQIGADIVTGITAGAPFWVKVSAIGSSITVSYSADGVAWTSSSFTDTRFTAGNCFITAYNGARSATAPYAIPAVVQGLFARKL